MPIYEYRCDQGHTFEVMQRMADDPVTSCTSCAASVQRVLHPVAVHFKGSGFYTTDYRDKRGASPDASGDDSKGDGGSDTGKEDADKAGAGSKSDKAGASSDAKGSTEKQNAEKKGSGKTTSSSSGSGSSSAG